jgi:hypothetical protein
VDGRKSGLAAGTATALKATVAGSSIATQFPETVEDYLENRRLRVLTVRARKRPEGLFTKLSGLKRQIDECRRRLSISEAWLAYSEYLTVEQLSIWRGERTKNREALRAAKQEFWTLNCPNRIDRANLQALEEAGFDGVRDFRAAKVQVWNKLCAQLDADFRAQKSVELTRPISERLDLPTKPSEEAARDEEDSRIVTGKADGKRPKKKARLNPERRRRLKEAADGGQEVPEDSTDTEVADKVEQVLDLTEEEKKEAVPASEQTGEPVADGPSGEDKARDESGSSSQEKDASLQTEKVEASDASVSGSGTETETDDDEVDWEEAADQVTDLENLPARARRRILDGFPKKRRKSRKSQK